MKGISDWASELAFQSLTPEVRFRQKQLFVLLVLLIAATFTLPSIVNFSLDRTWLRELALIALVPISGWAWVIWRKMNAIRPVVEVTVAMLLLMPSSLVCTYVAMRFNLPLADQVLVRMDRAIGFDWPAYIRWVDKSAYASYVLQSAYESAFYQLALLPLLLCLSGRTERAYHFVLTYGLLCASSSVIAAFFPSIGAYLGYGFDSSSLVNIDGSNGHIFLRSFHAVRNEQGFVLGAGSLSGILTFPSVHAGVAALCAWAAWPIVKLRYLIGFLNALMAVSAITHGAHYFVDILGGLLMALFVIMFSGKFAGENIGSSPCPTWSKRHAARSQRALKWRQS